MGARRDRIGRSAGGELRVRSGCWRCRGPFACPVPTAQYPPCSSCAPASSRSPLTRLKERRVKCSEERPVCRHCQRLGLRCDYGFRLTWQKPSCPGRGPAEAAAGGVPGVPGVSAGDSTLRVSGWMFLNTTLRDFRRLDDALRQEDSRCSFGPVAVDSAESTRLDGDGGVPSAASDPLLGGGARPAPPGPSSIPVGLSPMRMSSREGRLWDYFDNFITPKCAVADGPNPYRDVVLRLAAQAPCGPLFRVVMAVAASQMHSLGHGETEASAWESRGLALGSLRSRLASGQQTTEEVIITTVMMGFLEVSTLSSPPPPVKSREPRRTWSLKSSSQILQSCPSSWTVHVSYGQRLLMSSQALRATSPDLYHFAATWFVSHNVLAATARGPRPAAAPLDESSLLRSLDEHYVHTLTGCSRSLLCLLSDTTALASSMESQGRSARRGHGTNAAARCGRAGRAPSPRVAYQQRRDGLERELCRSASNPGDGSRPAGSGEGRDISEVKRLAALIYFYARVDGAGPHEGHVVRLTEAVLRLVPRVSLRTNTLLWPLFVVGAFGVRPGREGDRGLVLGTLDALQRTRQLGCVRRARCLVEDVWRARDLRSADAAMGWSVLDGRNSDVSLA